MSAWTYHNDSFPEDVRDFFASLRHGPRERNIGDGVVRDSESSFHLADLLAQDGHPDHLVHVRKPNLQYFAVSLTYVVLINRSSIPIFPVSIASSGT